MKKETSRWVRKAEADLRLAKAAAKERPPLHDGVCFHCQQSAEKYLKGFLLEIGESPPKTHDLVKLLDMARPNDATLGVLRRGLDFLTIFAVDFRYPDADATARQAKSALRWAGRVRVEIRQRLTLPTKS